MKTIKERYPFILSVILVTILWWMATTFSWINSLFLPTPGQFVHSIESLFFEREFLTDIQLSVFRVIAAFLLSAAVAIPLALVMCSFKTVNEVISPYIDFSRYIPVPAVIPLTILFFGIDESAKIALLFIGTFFQLVLLVIDDIRGIPKEYMDMAYTMHFGKWKIMGMMFRSALPKIYDDCRITLGWCWTYLIIAELVASERGIGHMIKEAQRFSNTSDVYVGIIVMGLIGFISDYTFKKCYPHIFKYESA